MHHVARFVIAVILAAIVIPAALAQDEQYTLGPDSQVQPGVPTGAVTKLLFESSKIFPNTTRDYYVYVPAQYKPGTEACLMVFQDGHSYVGAKGNCRAAVVFDNLIHKGEMPVTIGVFVNPGGHMDRQKPDSPWKADNRSYEYDRLTDDYVRFLLEELLPDAEKQANVKFTKDPAGRAICGASSGGICAFTAAWQRPEAFGKVVSHIGSFTSIAYRPATADKPLQPGGDLYPTLIRKTPIKPLRIFLQDGSNDLDNDHGHWFLANQQMLAALNYANAKADKANDEGPRYDVKHVWGEGKHSPVHGGAIFPETMRWIWRD